MLFAEIYVSPRPWTNERVLVGLAIEDPLSGTVKIVRSTSSADRTKKSLTLCSETRSRSLSQATNGSRQNVRRAETSDRFLSSLEQLAEMANGRSVPATVAAIMNSVPDRGTSYNFSPLQNVDFKSPQEALDFCYAKEIEKSKERAARKKHRTPKSEAADG